MIKINIRCPACGKNGYIAVEENLLKNSERGVTVVNIAPLLVCKHSFIAYIDRNFIVRDAFISDFKVELPELMLEDDDLDYSIPGTEDIDLYLISINIPAKKLSSIFRGMFFKKDILIVNDLEIIESHFHRLIKFIFLESFEVKFSFIESASYRENKKQYKEYIVFLEDKILNDKKNLLKSGKIDSAIVQKFLSITDTESSLITLKNEMTKAFLLSKEFCDHIAKYFEKKDDEVIEAKTIIETVEKNYNIELSLPYMLFLIEIIENYFEVKVPMSWKFFLIRPR